MILVSSQLRVVIRVVEALETAIVIMRFLEFWRVLEFLLGAVALGV